MLVVTFIPVEELLLCLIRREALYNTKCHETKSVCVNVILINIIVSHDFIKDRLSSGRVKVKWFLSHDHVKK